MTFEVGGLILRILHPTILNMISPIGHGPMQTKNGVIDNVSSAAQLPTPLRQSRQESQELQGKLGGPCTESPDSCPEKIQHQ
jgi:hypothetical protein